MILTMYIRNFNPKVRITLPKNTTKAKPIRNFQTCETILNVCDSSISAVHVGLIFKTTFFKWVVLWMSFNMYCTASTKWNYPQCCELSINVVNYQSLWFLFGCISEVIFFIMDRFVDRPRYVSHSFNLENIQSQVISTWNFHECLTLVITASMSGLNP